MSFSLREGFSDGVKERDLLLRRLFGPCSLLPLLLRDPDHVVRLMVIYTFFPSFSSLLRLNTLFFFCCMTLFLSLLLLCLALTSKKDTCDRWLLLSEAWF